MSEIVVGRAELVEVGLAGYAFVQTFAEMADKTMKESYKTQFELVRDVWPNAHSPEILLSREERVLAGRLLQCLLREMIEVSIARVAQNPNPEMAGTPDQFIAHQHMSVFERAVQALELFSVVTQVGDDDKFRVLIEPDVVPEYVRSREDLTREMFAEVIESCVNFGLQQEWKIPWDIVQDFRSAGLVDETEGTFDWSDKMIPYIQMSLHGECANAPEFFASICV